MSEDKERFVRWQQVTRDQLSFTNNTVLALATASLGFAVMQFTDGVTVTTSRFQVWVLPTVVALLLASHLCAIWCALNRLWDFRETAQIVKASTRGEDVAQTRQSNKDRGELTWTLLYWQVGTFAGAILIFTLASWVRAMQWV